MEVHQWINENVAVNRENDTGFGNGLAMGSADYLYYVGLVKTPEKLS